MTPEPDRADAFVAAAPAALGNAGAPALRLGAWEGPLDLLLELARAQRVDLAQLSIGTLAEQFTAVVDTAIARRQVPLSRLAEWHIMAAWLTLLRTRLLLPELPDDTARGEAAGLRQRLADRDAARHLADWLERQPQLGREVFARGEPEPLPTAGAAPGCGAANSPSPRSAGRAHSLRAGAAVAAQAVCRPVTEVYRQGARKKEIMDHLATATSGPWAAMSVAPSC